jgi:hypothetical protein
MRIEYITPKAERAICALVGYDANEKQIRFNKQEIAVLKQAQSILDKASKVYEAREQCEPDENPYFVASVEIGYTI